MRLLLLLLTCLAAAPVAWSENIVLSGQAWHHNLTKEGLLFHDPDKAYGYRDIMDFSPDNALAEGEQAAQDGRCYWLRATVRNLDAPEALNLRVNSTQLSDVRFYLIKDGALIADSHQGAIPWSYLPVSDIYPSFNLPVHLPPGETLTIILRYESNRFNRNLITELLPARQAFHSNIAEVVFIIFIIGMILVLALYNAIIGIATRRMAYIWYALHASSYVILFFFIFGYMARFFSVTDENFRYYQLASNCAQLAGLMFTSSFFDLKSLAPRIALFYRGYAGIVIAQMVISLGLEINTPYQLLALQQVLHGPLILTTAGLALHRGFTAAWFVMAGWFFISLAIAWGILTQLGLLPPLNIVREAILASVGLDMLLLSLAMAYQFRRMEKEQMAMRRKEEIQDRFLATLSHEVRTPLSSIISLVSSVIERLDKRPERKVLEEVKYSADALLSMVDNLLLFTRSKRHVVQAQQNRFEPRILLKSVIALFTERSQSNRVTLSVRFSPHIPGQLIGDEVLLRQIVINLLGNAIKHTRNGSVTVTLTPISLQPDRCTLSIAIADTGEGIPESERKRIFDQFYRVETHSGRGGAGMGLYIVSELVKVLDGEQRLSSEVGKGTTVTLILPFLLPQEHSPAAADDRITDRLADTSLLLVEDEPALRQLIDEMVSPYGVHVIEAANAAEALHRIADSRPDYILADLHLPDQGGVPLVQQLSERLEQSGLASPLILMTASTNAVLHAELKTAAVADTLIKPIEADKLIAVLLAKRGKTGPQHLDLAIIAAHREAMGDSAFAALIARYNDTTRGYIHDLGDAIEEGNDARIVYLAHKISGLAASFGMKNISASAERLQRDIETLDGEARRRIRAALERRHSACIKEMAAR